MLVTFDCPQCGATLEIEANSAGSRVECPECHASLTVPKKEVEPGTTIGGFRIAKLLGKGGMGQVFLARQLAMDRNVALKILPPEFTSQQPLVQRFLNEVRTAARLEHPNIVTAYDAGEDSGVYYMAMAYVKGEGLNEKLQREGAIAEKEALHMVRKLVPALAYAWDEHRMLHRDIKPANIMLDRHGEPKITDMGLSKSLVEDSGMTVSGTVMGTPNYMSPEQAEGRKEIDFRADMYSLGATLYHMVTGAKPFDGTSFVETLRKQLGESLPDPREFNQEISEACVKLMETMLAKEPERRYPDWSALAADIDRALKGHCPSQATVGAGESVLMRSNVFSQAHAQEPKKVVVGHTALERLHKAGAVQKKPERARRCMVAMIPAAAAVVVIAGVIGGVVAVQRRAQARKRMAAETQAARAAAEEETAKKAAAASAKAEKTSALERQLAAAAEYAGKHPDDYAETISRFEQVRQSGAGGEFEARAAEEIRRIGAARRNAVNHTMSKLKMDAETLLAGGKTDQAVSLVTDHSGRFAKETSRERKALAETLAQQGAEQRKRESRRTEAAKASMAELLNAIAADLLKQDFASVRNRIAQAEEDHSLSPVSSEWKAVRELTAKVVAMQEVISGSFKQDIGKEVTVFLEKGPEKLQIADVGKKEIRAKRLVRSQGRVVGSAARNFSIDDLGTKERFRRLGKEETAELDIMRGLLAFHVKALDKAKEYFEQSDCRLGETLNRHIKSFPVKTEEAVPAREASAGKEAAEKAYQSLLSEAGLSAEEQDIDKLTTAIREKRFSSAQVDDIKRRLEAFRAKYGETDLAEAHAPLLQALDGIRPRIPLEVDRSTVDAAMEKFKADNRWDAGGRIRRDIEQDGIAMHIAPIRPPYISNISALAGLPIKSLIISKAKLTDIHALKGMPLKRLELITHECEGIRDLSPLKGMQLEILKLAIHEDSSAGRFKGVRDLSLLKGMPLKYLSLCFKSIRDLSPLEGIPLEELQVFFGDRIRDLSPLKDMPLKTLGLAACHRIDDLRPLKGLPLETLHVVRCRVLSDFRPLKDMPLKELSVQHCNELTDLSFLKGMRLGTLTLLRNDGIRDLSPLKGMPLETLDVTRCHEIRDLSPLKGMPLEELLLEDCERVRDLSPLQGMPLSTLNIKGTSVTDITPLKDMKNLELIR